MDFTKFTSLENTYKQKVVDKAIREGFDRQEWVVTEKIDGANFAFYYNGSILRVASRNQFVDGTFFNCQQVINKYENNILSMYEAFKSDGGVAEGDVLIIRGELYGDSIQRRVKYGEVDFAAFELQVKDKVLSFNGVINLCGAFKIPFVPVILEGSFGDCLKEGNTFKSLLTPKDLEGENFAEGLSIQPKTPSYFNTGSRVWFKNKSDTFTEGKVGRKPKTAVVLSVGDSDILEKLNGYNNSSRVMSAISKVGTPTQKDFSKIMEMVVQDAIVDYNEDNDTNLKLVVEDWKTFSKYFKREVTIIVREEFVKWI